MTTSMTGEDLGGTTLVARRLSVFAATTGALCMIFFVAGLVLGGQFTGSDATGAIAIAGLVGVLSTVLSGYQAGLYLGIGLMIVASRTSSDEVATWQLVALILAVMAGHEACRLSLDARRPARFGPGFLRRHAMRSTVPVLIAGSAAAILHSFDPSSLPAVLVPVGFLSIAAIGFTRRAMSTRALISAGPTLRAALSGAVGVSLVAIVTVAARARGQIESATPGLRPPPPAADSAPVRPLPDLGFSGDGSDPIGIVILLIVFVIAGLLYFALKRPEADFELDDYELDELDLGLAVVGSEQIAIDDESEMIDEEEFKDLLDELLLDIAAEKNPGRAIRFGYANVQQRLAHNEMARRHDETEREFLTRALPTLGGEGDAMVELTNLFERARFSDHDVDETMRQRALRSVERLRAQATTNLGDTGRAEEMPS